jgi:hypothetical protein
LESDFVSLSRIDAPAFAKGGFVTKPTLAMIGEGGQPEWVVPQSKAFDFASNIMSGMTGASALKSSNNTFAAMYSAASADIASDFNRRSSNAFADAVSLYTSQFTKLPTANKTAGELAIDQMMLSMFRDANKTFDQNSRIPALLPPDAITGEGGSYLPMFDQLNNSAMQSAVSRFNTGFSDIPIDSFGTPSGNRQDTLQDDMNRRVADMFKSGNQRFQEWSKVPVVMPPAPQSYGPVNINIQTGPVMEINGKLYATQDDLERAMRATVDGVFSTLRTPSARMALGGM